MNLLHRNSRLVLVFVALGIFALGFFTVNVGAGSVHLVWDPPPDGAGAGYHLYRSVVSGGPYTRLNESPLLATYYSDDSAVAGKTYYYTVTSMGGNGHESAYSKEISVTVAAYETAPSASVPTIGTVSELIADAGQLAVLSAGAWNSGNEPLTYTWTQVAESTVGILGADRPEASFIAPLVVQDTILTFTVSVKTRNGSETVESVQVLVRPRFP